MTTRLRRWGLASLFLLSLGALLACYALLGRGFAYAGLPPLFVGEMVLGVGVAAAASPRGMRALRAVFRASATACWLAALMLWGARCTIPQIPIWGRDALRDAVLWGYGAFALLVAAFLLDDLDRLRTLVRRYRRFTMVLALLLPVLWGSRFWWPDGVVRFPEAPTGVPSVKSGDALVHLCGLTSSFVTGFLPGSPIALPPAVALTAALAASTRSGMLAFGAGLAVAFGLRPTAHRLSILAAMGIIGLSVLLLVEPRVPLRGGERELSAKQLVSNFVSIFGESEDSGLNATKGWRLGWWKRIVDYTVFGPYFWTGKGYGINIASDDGFLVQPELRSPHNGHMTFLARSGVPGFLLWLATLSSWAFGLLKLLKNSRARGETRWANFAAFLLAYATAFLVNASFDVFLEGPVGGIWFWTLFGVGMVAPVAFLRTLAENESRQGTSSI